MTGYILLQIFGSDSTDKELQYRSNICLLMEKLISERHGLSILEWNYSEHT